ncbi:MAG: tetratricopeptide repeat protein [Bacteroidota bacterium]
MKKFQNIFFLLILTNTCVIAEGDALKEYQAGNAAYKAKDYEAAITAYERCLANSITAPELEFNLGNACYKAGKNAEAILHYERALKLSPSDDDIRYNLRLANLKNTDRIETIPKVFYERWSEGLTMLMNERSWSVLLLFLLWLTFGTVSFYFLTRVSKLKKTAFFGSIGLLIILFMTWSFTADRSDSEFGNDRAVIMKTSVYVKSSPDEKGNDLFILHDGTTVDVLDELEGWKRIRISNGSSGWLPSTFIEVI